MQELERALAGARIARTEAEVGIDHADEIELGEVVSLGDELRADHDVDLAVLDRFELGAHALHRGHQVAREHQHALFGKEAADLFLEPLDARPAGDEGVRRLALRAVRRARRVEAAVMADERALEAVLDQPGVAVRAVEPEAAGAAERERRIAAPVQEQQRLLAALQRGVHRFGKPRRDETAARRAFAAQIDWLDHRLGIAAKALRQREPAVAPASRVDDGLDGGRRGREHDRDVGDARTHHRHVARVIMRAVLLLVDRVVLLIDHDQAEVGVREKQRGARADHDAHPARGDRRPGARALAGAELGMPFGRTHAEALREAVEELRRECDLGQEHQRLSPFPDRLGDRLEIDLGLARPGHAVEQVDHEAAMGDRGAQDVGRHALRGGELRIAVVGIRLARDRLGRKRHDLKRALVDQAVDHAGRHAGILRGLGFRAQQPVGERIHRAAACRREPLRRPPGKTHRDALALRPEFAHPQRHAQHRAARGQCVVRHPVDELAQLGLERRYVELGVDVLQAIVQAGIDRDVARPHHADGLALPQRHRDHVAGLQREVGRRAVRIGAVERDRHQDVDDALRHWRVLAILEA